MVKIEKKFRFKRDWWGYIFILPFFIAFAVFQFYPMVSSIFFSITDYAGFEEAKKIVWLDNFKYLWNQPRFWYSFYNTAVIWIMNFIPQIFFALLFAAIFTSVRLRMRGGGAFKVIYFMPNIITATSIAVLFASLLNYPDGPIDQLIKKIGLVAADYNLFRDDVAGKIVIAFIQYWRYFGHSMIILVAGMLGINPALYEAAEVDGASKPRMFFSITLPLLKPILLFSLVTSLVGGLQMFEIPYLFMDGGPHLSNGREGTETIAVYIYKRAFQNDMEYAKASAASVYLFVISVILSVAVIKLFSARKEKKAERDGL